MNDIPNPNELFPNEYGTSCFIKNAVTAPNIQIGDYTYYDDSHDPAGFERNNVLFNYPEFGDRLIIGKFCAIARGVTFIMNGANHRMCSATTYPFNIMGGGWEKSTPRLEELPFKGDTVIGNDVWIGERVTFLPGARVGDGAIIGAGAVVAGKIPAYAVAVGNPCRVVKKRFDEETIRRLLELRWWDWPAEKIFASLEALTSADMTALLAEARKADGVSKD